VLGHRARLILLALFVSFLFYAWGRRFFLWDYAFPFLHEYGDIPVMRYLGVFIFTGPLVEVLCAGVLWLCVRLTVRKGTLPS
jgi:hypothetical protein